MTLKKSNFRMRRLSKFVSSFLPNNKPIWSSGGSRARAKGGGGGAVLIFLPCRPFSLRSFLLFLPKIRGARAPPLDPPLWRARMMTTQHICRHFRALYGACSKYILLHGSPGYLNESGYHRMHVNRRIRFEYATCGRENI